MSRKAGRGPTSAHRQATKGLPTPPVSACVFDKAIPLRNEHVWPKWLLKQVYPPRFKARKVSGRYPGLVSFNATSVATKLAIVCQPCNGGWMRRTEDAAKPLLLPWIKGVSLSPSLDEQKAMATWAVKTVMMLQFTQNEFPVPPAHFNQLFARKTSPPDGTYVFIGIEPDRTVLPRAWFRIRFMGFSFDDYSRLLPTRTLHPGYEATLVIDHLVMIVVAHDGPPSLRVGELLSFRGPLTRIWPSVSSRGVLLPTRD